MLFVTIVVTVLSVAIRAGVIDRYMEMEIARGLTALLEISQLGGAVGDAIVALIIIQDIVKTLNAIDISITFIEVSIDILRILLYIIMNHFVSTIAGVSTYAVTKVVGVIRGGSLTI